MTGKADHGRPGPWSALAIHAAVYVVVNALIIAVWVLFGGGSSAALGSLLTNLDAARAQGFWPIYVILGWGAALMIHLAVVAATTPGRRRARRQARRQARRRAEVQASVVGALPDGLLTDAALTGIRLTEGDKAARQVQRTAARRSEPRRSRPPGRAAARPADRRGTRARPTTDAPSSDPPPSDTPTSGSPTPDSSTPDAAAPTGTGEVARRPWVVVVFTDIVESTTLNEALGDETWAEVLADHRALVRRWVSHHRGHEVGTQGDGALLRFDSPENAVAAAVDIQRDLARQRAAGVANPVPAVRMGVHAGEAVPHDGDDLVGRVINLAARVTDAADPGEILVTEPVADHLDRGVVLVDRGLRPLKGFDRPRHLLAVVWQPAAETIDLGAPVEDPR